MTAPVRFDGKDLYQPGYYGKANFSGADVAAPSGSRLLILGECKAGIPYNASTDYPNPEDRVNWISNTNELDEILRDGPAYYGTWFALTPANQPGVNGAPAVGVIRVNPATQSTLTIKDVDTDDVLDLTSKDYGLYTSQIRLQISAGTNEGKKVSVKLEDKTVEADDIIYDLLQVQYTGAGSAAAMTLDPAGNLVVTITAGGAGDDVTLDLAVYDTVQAIVDALNAYQNTAGTNIYSAVLTGDGTFKSNKLDKIVVGDAVDIKTAYNVLGILQAVTDWFNNQSELISAALTSGAERRVPANMPGFVYLTGGSEGSTTATNWTDALNQVAEVVDASFIGAMTSDASVHAAVKEHVKKMSSSTGRNERQACLGGDVDDAESVKKTNAQNLNSELVGFCGHEIVRYNKFGEQVTWDGFYSAAEILGMTAGNGITFSPTKKTINALAVKTKFRSSSLDEFIKKGVIIAQTAQEGGLKTVKAVTTYQGSNKILNEWSAMRTALFVTKDHRVYVESLIGEPGDNTVLESIKSRALRRLDHYVDQKYFAVDPAFGNAYRNVQFTVEGDVVKITYEATLVIPVNFILVTHNFTVIGAKR
jgi:hypothetical protein